MPLKGLEKGAGKEVRSAHISVLKINGSLSITFWFCSPHGFTATMSALSS